MSRCERALAAVICFGFGSCVLPEATEIDGTNDGGAGSGGSGGSAGASTCAESSGKWPDSTPYCSDGEPAPCPHATEDGSIQGAIPSFSPGTGGGDTLVDSVTGLEWEQDANQQAALWAGANAHCEGLGNGWRMPTLLELTSLADYGRAPVMPAEFSQGFGFFWTSSVHPTGNHWGVNFAEGVVGGWGDNIPGTLNVRCVRGTALSTSLASVGQSVCDAATGLEWQREAGGETDWAAALAMCEALGSGWRLPSVKELMTLYVPESSEHLPAAFPAAERGDAYWSSTPVKDDSQRVWAVDYGAEQLADLGAGQVLKTASYHVRCVRD
jgi:hypothetical protein